MFTSHYDVQNPSDIERHAKQLENHCLNDYIQELSHCLIPNYSSSHKGQLGNLVEEIFFGYKPNSIHDADFEQAGVELKVTPLKSTRDKITTKERLILSMINFNTVVHEDWETNTLINKLRCILFMFYLHEKKPALDLIFKVISLWTPSKADLIQIQQDWEFIVDKIKHGNAHTLSEADTNYLGACPKGKNKEDTTTQPCSDARAMRRAFSLKSSYMRTVYETLSAEQSDYVPIAPEGNFEERIKAVFAPFVGQSIQSFINANTLKTPRSQKHFNKLLVEEFLTKTFGAASDKIEEFKKAGVSLKTILLQENGVPRESMSFKQIQYKEIISEEWENFEINKIHEEGRFFWVIFKAQKKYARQSELSLDDIVLEKVMFWSMPYEDLQVHYRALWEHTKAQITSGNYKNFLNASQHPVGHIRPKGRNAEDTMETPQGTMEPKKCFWINAKYISEQILKSK